MTTPRTMKAAAMLLAVYGGLGTVLSGTGPQWPMLLFPAAAFVLAHSGQIARALTAALGLSLAAACAFVAWKASVHGGPEWFVGRYQLTSVFWLGIATLLAAPLFRRDETRDESADEASVEVLEAEPEAA